MNRSTEISGSLLTRNTILNFIGQVIPLIVGVITIPFIVHGLGTDLFGILSLVWVILGYFSILDLGLGRATTKFVAEFLGKGKLKNLLHLVWTSLAFHVLLGMCGGIILKATAPFLVERVFNVPVDLVSEVKLTFSILAISVPIVLATASLRAVLEAMQRFDLINAIKIPSSSLTFLVPIIAITLGFRLPGIVILLLVAKLVSFLAYLVLSARVLPFLKQNFSFERRMIGPLFSFGGWVTASNIVSMILIYGDRFLIGSLLTMSAVTYYSAPSEVISRLWLLPASMAAILLPAFSTLGASKKQKDLEYLFRRSIKYLILIMVPLVMILFLFAEEFLRLWLGNAFAEKSTVVFQILALGVLVNSLGMVPFALLQGLGRPDIPTKFHLLELPLYIGSAWFLIKTIGISGAALAWAGRMLLDAVLLYGASWKLCRIDNHILAQNGMMRMMVMLLVLAGLLLFIIPLKEFVLFQVIAVFLLITIFVFLSWRYVLDVTERRILTSVLGQLIGMGRGGR